MANKATIQIVGENAKLKDVLKDSEQAFVNFGTTIKRTLAAAAGFLAARRLINWGKSFVAAYSDATRAQAKLSAVIRASGDNIGYTADEISALATAWQNVSIFEDDALKSAVAVAAVMEHVRGDTLRDAVEAAMDLASVMDQDIQSAVFTVARALEDPLRGMMMLRRQGIIFSQELQDKIKASMKAGDLGAAQQLILGKLREAFGGAAQEVADSLWGQFKQLSNRFGDIAESIGQALLPVVSAVGAVLESLASVLENAVVPAFANFMSWASEVGGVILDTVAPALDALLYLFVALGETVVSVFEGMATATGITFGDIGELMHQSLQGWVSLIQDFAGSFIIGWVGLFTALETAVANWKDFMIIAAASVALGFVKAFENVKYFFTEVIPPLLEWFGRNWYNVLVDLAEATGTIFSNMWDNISMFFSNVLAWLSGEETDWQWKGLLDGFESTLEALPEIAARQKSLMELLLEEAIRDSATNIEEDFDRRMKERMDRINRITEGIKNSFKRADQPEAPARRGTLLPSFQPKEDKKKDKKEDEFKASVEDLVALNKRISAAAANKPEDKIIKKLGEGQERAADAAEEQVDAIEEGNEMMGELVALTERQTKALEGLNLGLV